MVRPRLTAAKSLHIGAVGDPKAAVAELVAKALGWKDARVRVVVYVRSPAIAKEIADAIRKDKTVGKDRVAVLTGTIRGHERDVLVASDLFRGFRAEPKREKPPQTQYLVATSAGEVGIDLDADHMVADLTSLDSMIQRLGRVNRLGEGAARIDVVQFPPQTKTGEASDDGDERIQATRAILELLPASSWWSRGGPRYCEQVGGACRRDRAAFSRRRGWSISPTFCSTVGNDLDRCVAGQAPGGPLVARRDQRSALNLSRMARGC